MLPAASREFWKGVRAELPILLGVMPFGLIYGVLAVEAGLDAFAAQAMSAVVFAGSAQFILAQLVAAGASAVVMVLTVAVVNLRHLLYSASVAPYLQHLSPAWKSLLAYFLTDEAFAVVIIYYEQTGPPPRDPHRDQRHWYFLGAGFALWATWQLSTAAGIFLGAQVPASWSLDFTLALTFIALSVPAMRDRAGLAAALSAGVVAVAGARLPYGLDLIGAALVGIAVGLLVESRMKPAERRALAGEAPGDAGPPGGEPSQEERAA